MLKLLTLLGLVFAFVYSDTANTFDKPILANDTPTSPTKYKEESKNSVPIIKDEHQSRRPCREQKNRQSNDIENAQKFESLPMSANTEQINERRGEHNLVLEDKKADDYNYNPKHSNSETVNNKLRRKNCTCDDCNLEAKKKVIQFETVLIDSNNTPSKKDTSTIDSEKQISDDNLNTSLRRKNCGSIIHSKNLPRPETTDVSGVSSRGNLPSRRIIPGLLENPTHQDLEDNIHFQNNSPFKPKYNPDQLKTTIEERQNFPMRANLPSRRLIPSLLENPTHQDLEDNILLQNNSPFKPKYNPEEDKTTIEERQNFPNVHKITNTYGIDLVQNMNVNAMPEQEPERTSELSTDNKYQLMEPTKGKGIYDMKDTGVMLLEHTRVCYACSTYNDPTCWNPDRRTTVKYCRKGHHSCLTKSFEYEGMSVTIRDCGNTCTAGDHKYKSCSICHYDLCNGASSISFYNTGIAVIVTFGILLKKMTY